MSGVVLPGGGALIAAFMPEAEPTPNLGYSELPNGRGGTNLESMRPRIEDDRRVFLTAMAEIKKGMILGVDNNIYVEPAIWTIDGPVTTTITRSRDRIDLRRSAHCFMRRASL